MKQEFSLERIVPDQMDQLTGFDQASLKLHLERYVFAERNANPGRILDIACGTGYGSFHLITSEKFKDSRITAVDIEQEAIDYGETRYKHPAIHFICADAMKFSDPDSYDTIVSLETIEHLNDPQLFVVQMYSILKKGGVMIVSAPVTPSTDANPYHLTDFTRYEFRQLFSKADFTEEASLLQIQPFSLKEVFGRKEKRLHQVRRNLLGFYFRNPSILLKRAGALLSGGLKNKYLVLALRKL